MLDRIGSNKEDSRNHWYISFRLSNSCSHLGMDMEQIAKGRISDNLYDLGMGWYSLVLPCLRLSKKIDKKVLFKGEKVGAQRASKREHAGNITNMGRRNRGKS